MYLKISTFVAGVVLMLLPAVGKAQPEVVSPVIYYYYWDATKTHRFDTYDEAYDSFVAFIATNLAVDGSLSRRVVGRQAAPADRLSLNGIVDPDVIFESYFKARNGNPAYWGGPYAAIGPQLSAECPANYRYRRTSIPGGTILECFTEQYAHEPACDRCDVAPNPIPQTIGNP